MKIHNVFHVSLLKSYISPSHVHSNQDIIHRPPPLLVDDQQEYEVERLVDTRTIRGRIQYLVHWLGYADSDQTWVDIADLGNALDLVSDFEDNLPLAVQFHS